MMFTLLKRISYEVLAFVPRSAATVNSSSYNSGAYGKASLIVRTGAETGSPSGRTLDVKLQGTPDGGTTWIDITSGAITQITAANANQQKYDINIQGWQSIRVVSTLGFTGGSSPTLQTQVLLCLYQV